MFVPSLYPRCYILFCLFICSCSTFVVVVEKLSCHCTRCSFCVLYCPFCVGCREVPFLAELLLHSYLPQIIFVVREKDTFWALFICFLHYFLFIKELLKLPPQVLQFLFSSLFLLENATSFGLTIAFGVFVGSFTVVVSFTERNKDVTGQFNRLVAQAYIKQSIVDFLAIDFIVECIANFFREDSKFVVRERIIQ